MVQMDAKEEKNQMKILRRGNDGYVLPYMLALIMALSLLLSGLSMALETKHKSLQKEANMLYQELKE